MTLETRVLAPLVTIAQRGAARVRPGLRLPACVPPSLARTWRHEIALDHRKADARLGFRRIPPGVALAAAAAWFNGLPR